MKWMPFLLCLLVGCVQAPNRIPDEPLNDTRVPSVDDAVDAKPVAEKILAKARPGDRESLRRYAAMYAAAADATSQSDVTAGKVLAAVKQMPTHFVKDRLEWMPEIVKSVMPDTSDPESVKRQITAGWLVLSAACLMASERLK